RGEQEDGEGPRDLGRTPVVPREDLVGDSGKLRFRILTAMFVVGVFATLSQVLLMREMLVAFFGSELVIGVVLASWLVGIGAGAFSGRAVLRFATTAIGKRRWLVTLSLLLAVCLPLQLYAIRVVRSILDVPVGECAPYGAILLVGALVFLPGCWCIGCMFPLACGALVQADEDAEEKSPASLVYVSEALGSTAAGLVMTFLLLPAWSPYRVVLLAMAISLVGMIAMAPRRAVSGAGTVLAAVLAVLAMIYPQWMADAEHVLIEARWRSFGVIAKSDGEERGEEVALVRTRDTIYQNLAVTEAADQFVLYANGQVVSVFPDAVAYEDSVHFAMAQKPTASNVLLIGGNPVGDVPELLKYPLSRLTCVDLDPGVREIVRATLPERYSEIAADPRIEWVPADAPRYLKGRHTFDVVLIHAPDPTTASANRFYTKEFYETVRAVLAPGGFVYTEVTSSERLRSEAADLTASVHAALKDVFGVVLVTAESRKRFFAAKDGSSGLTFDRQTLRDKSLAAGVKTDYFNPEYFLYRDEIDPDKVALVERRLSEIDAAPNALASPTTYYHSLLLAGRLTESRSVRVLSALKNTSHWWGACACMVIGLACLGTGFLLARTARHPGRELLWARTMAGSLVATTGFCGMALEILLIFVFQAMYGYVYAKMGAIVAAFMLGLILGAWAGRTAVRLPRRRRIAILLLAQFVMLSLALAIPRMMRLDSMLPSTHMWLVELAAYGVVTLLGCGVGVTFPLANKLYADAGGRVDAAAAITDASDHVGAAIGALLTGIVLIPVYGIVGASAFIGAVLLLGALCLASACLAMRHHTAL
ncbi:MAG: hypothetical protein KAI66_02360, partial [Lentisphaeria bacterium]|nr:hypothetical protein [Lentisphaeria bacterium]